MVDIGICDCFGWLMLVDWCVYDCWFSCGFGFCFWYDFFGGYCWLVRFVGIINNFDSVDC